MREGSEGEVPATDDEGTPPAAIDADAFRARGEDLEVAVIGAGAVGATAAYDLAREGADATLYERGSVASGASGRAAGICYTAFPDEKDAEIAVEAIERFRSLSGEETFPFVECPYVWFARTGDEARAEAIRDGVSDLQRQGVVAVEMDGPALGERFPSLETDDVAVAGVAGGAGYTDPTRYTACLVAAATGVGATLETHTPVEVRTDPTRVVSTDDGAGPSRIDHEVDAVLVAAGAHTNRVLAGADLSVAMKPYRVQALIADQPLAEPMWYDASADVYARPHEAGLLAGDGTEPVEADPANYDRDGSPEFERSVSARLRERLGVDGIGIERSWAGLATATPDRDPLLGPVADGVFVATGFHGEGFMRAPAFGQRLAAAIVGGEPVERFDPTRFDGDTSFTIDSGMSVFE